MARVSYLTVAAAALVVSSAPLVQSIGQWPPSEIPVTETDIARLDSNMLNTTAYASDVTMRVCYKEITQLRDYVYTGHTYFYRLKACEVSTVTTPKCSETQLAACTPAFYTVGISDREPKLTIVTLRKDEDQSVDGLGNWVQGGNGSDAGATTVPTNVVTTPSPTTTESTGTGTASNNTEAGAVTAPTAAVPTSTPKQSDAVALGAGCAALASAVATLAASFASL